MKRSEAYRLLATWLLAEEYPAEPHGRCDWPLIIEAASHHLVTPGIAWALRGSAWVPAEVADYFDAVLALNRARNMRLLNGLAEVGTLMEQAGLRPLLMKGAGLLALDLFPDPGSRVMGDLDLLLPGEAELAAAAELLTGRGFTWEARRDDREHQLAMAVHPEHGFGIELHRRLAPNPYGQIFDTQVILGRAETVDVAGAGLLVPAAADRIGIALVHGQLQDRGAEQGIVPLRLVLDIAAHLRLPGGRDAFDAGLAQPTGVTGRPFQPVSLLVAACGEPGNPLPPRLRRSLDSRWTRQAALAARIARTLPSFARMDAAERRRALSAERWRRRIAYHLPRW